MVVLYVPCELDTKMKSMQSQHSIPMRGDYCVELFKMHDAVTKVYQLDKECLPG